MAMSDSSLVFGHHKPADSWTQTQTLRSSREWTCWAIIKAQWPRRQCHFFWLMHKCNDAEKRAKLMEYNPSQQRPLRSTFRVARSFTTSSTRWNSTMTLLSRVNFVNKELSSCNATNMKCAVLAKESKQSSIFAWPTLEMLRHEPFVA
jgi:hypothetical protein